MLILGIDPGETTSGVVLYCSQSHAAPIANNAIANADLERLIRFPGTADFCLVCCEDISPMGVPFSRNLRTTCRVVDRIELLCELTGKPIRLLKRLDIKTVLCGSAKGVSDANIATRVRDLFGGQKQARGTKKNPGPCYGVSGHAWQALAVVMAWLEMDKQVTAIERERGE